MDLSQYGNVTWPQRRVPRVIHQTYRTYDIPAIWNRSVQSVMTMNTGEFQYRRWSHADMDAFVRQREPHFYWNTFVKYRYDMQRIDSFRIIASADVLASISTKAPDPLFYPHMPHPSQPQRLNLSHE
ncbi:unnamed protein product [Rotaria sordida]|uniref:Uncharacterized protein n=1 Tax=Rotaria sordida TaxID=392033 RepID=A0A815V4F8_9BILA|nr:unnamed protein product [Rotaria sordida]CAF1525173.1 unnamed protein product [Rotaria sordida]